MFWNRIQTDPTCCRSDETADEILLFLDKVFYYYDIPGEFSKEEKMDQLFNTDQANKKIKRSL